MLALHGNDRLFLYREAADMRKGFDGLSGLVRNELKQDPCSGDVFIFLNRRRNRIKLLRWERQGFSIYYKRLESGRIELPSIAPNKQSIPLNWATLAMMLEGVSLQARSQKKRFSFTEKQP